MMEPSGKAYALSDMRQELGGPDPRHVGTPTATVPRVSGRGTSWCHRTSPLRCNDGATFDSVNGGTVEAY
jgi:hypothetical protein